MNGPYVYEFSDQLFRRDGVHIDDRLSIGGVILFATNIVAINGVRYSRFPVSRIRALAFLGHQQSWPSLGPVFQSTGNAFSYRRMRSILITRSFVPSARGNSNRIRMRFSYYFNLIMCLEDFSFWKHQGGIVIPIQVLPIIFRYVSGLRLTEWPRSLCKTESPFKVLQQAMISFLTS